MSLSTYYLEYGSHVARFHRRRRRRRRVYAPTSNTTAHETMRKPIHGFLFSLYGYGAPLGVGPPELRYHEGDKWTINVINFLVFWPFNFTITPWPFKVVIADFPQFLWLKLIFLTTHLQF